MNHTRGVFIAVDGPKYAGKTSVLEEVVRILEHADVATVFTKEPTPGFRLDNEQEQQGRSLALLLAADRAKHVATTIRPALDARAAVVTDRYVGSSLVFQTLDGVPFEEVWALNRHFPLPDLNIFVTADMPSLLRRRSLRTHHTRLEQASPRSELRLYDRVEGFMRQLGVQTVRIDNSDGRSEAEAAEAIAAQIVQATGAQYV